MSVMKTFCGCVSTKTGSLAILAFYIVSFIRKLESFLASIQQFLVITFNIPVFLHPRLAPKILLTSRSYGSIYCFVKRRVCVKHETASPIRWILILLSWITFKIFLYTDCRNWPSGSLLTEDRQRRLWEDAGGERPPRGVSVRGQ